MAEKSYTSAISDTPMLGDTMGASTRQCAGFPIARP